MASYSLYLLLSVLTDLTDADLESFCFFGGEAKAVSFVSAAKMTSAVCLRLRDEVLSIMRMKIRQWLEEKRGFLKSYRCIDCGRFFGCWFLMKMRIRMRFYEWRVNNNYILTVFAGSGETGCLGVAVKAAVAKTTVLGGDLGGGDTTIGEMDFLGDAIFLGDLFGVMVFLGDATGFFVALALGDCDCQCHEIGCQKWVGDTPHPPPQVLPLLRLSFFLAAIWKEISME